MDKLKTTLKTIAQWVMLLVLGSVGLIEAGSVTLYQQALVAEKNVGDLETALQLYEQILVDIKSEDVWIANQVRERVAILRKRLGLPKKVDAQQLPNETQYFRQMLFSRSQTRREPSPYLQAIDRQFSDLKSRLGVDRSARNEPEIFRKLYWIETQFHKARRILGIQSFSEKIVEVAARRRQLRPMNFVGLFQAGLNAEKGTGDFEVAIGYYQRALNRAPETTFKVQINKRLAFCQQQMKP